MTFLLDTGGDAACLPDIAPNSGTSINIKKAVTVEMPGMLTRISNLTRKSCSSVIMFMMERLPVQLGDLAVLQDQWTVRQDLPSRLHAGGHDLRHINHHRVIGFRYHDSHR